MIVIAVVVVLILMIVVFPLNNGSVGEATKNSRSKILKFTNMQPKIFQYGLFKYEYTSISNNENDRAQVFIKLIKNEKTVKENNFFLKVGEVACTGFGSHQITLIDIKDASFFIKR